MSPTCTISYTFAVRVRISTQRQPSDSVRPRKVNSMSELESLASRASQLASKVDFWNSAVLWSLLITALAAGAIVVSQRLAFVRAKQLSEVQDDITRIKEASGKDRANNLDQANLKLRTDLEKEIGKVAGLQTDAANAKAAQQRVETDLAKQQEKTANAERSLLQLQRRIEPRRISAEQRLRLIGILTPGPKGKVSIDCVLGDGEGQTFANDVDEVLKASGWETDGVNQVVYSGGNPVGFGIIVRSAIIAPPYAAHLQQAFFSIGLPMGGIENPKLADGKVQILVGNKPN